MGDFILYTNGDDRVRVNVHIEDDTVWLTQKQLGELFGVDRSVVTKHIGNIFTEGELEESSVCAKIAHTAADGKKYKTNHYNLDMIISLGYRVNSKVATSFRIWATRRLNEYITKGYAMDDERLKQGGGRYFKELLQRIRDIRSSERNFYQQVTDIYATSVDYKKDTAETKQFFATVQNKLHYAVHGMTAAEMIYARADADKSLMGLTNFKGDYVTVDDAEVAKNYLTEEELMTLNLIVSQYLDYAELQALRHKTMTMADWSTRLDTFIKNNEANVLVGAGKKSHTQALKKARTEYEKYRTQEMAGLESDFDREVVRLAKEVKSGENNIVDEAISLELREYLDKEFFEKLDNINEKNPKILVVFAGGNAVGKSTLSAKIVKEFHGLRLNNDDIRRAIVRKFPELSHTQRVNELLWQYSVDMYSRLEGMTPNGLIIRDAIITGSYEKVLPKFEARRYRLFVVGYNLSDEKIQQLIIDRGDVDITTVPRMLSQMEFHKQNRQRFFREYDADIMLDDESVFEHDRVIDALRETINAAD